MNHRIYRAPRLVPKCAVRASPSSLDFGSRIRCGRQKAARRRWRLDAHPEPSGRLRAKPLPVFLAHITDITWSSFGPVTDVTDEALGPPLMTDSPERLRAGGLRDGARRRRGAVFLRMAPGKEALVAPGT